MAGTFISDRPTLLIMYLCHIHVTKFDYQYILNFSLQDWWCKWCESPLIYFFVLSIKAIYKEFWKPLHFFSFLFHLYIAKESAKLGNRSEYLRKWKMAMWTQSLVYVIVFTRKQTGYLFRLRHTQWWIIHIKFNCSTGNILRGDGKGWSV